MARSMDKNDGQKTKIQREKSLDPWKPTHTPDLRAGKSLNTIPFMKITKNYYTC